MGGKSYSRVCGQRKCTMEKLARANSGVALHNSVFICDYSEHNFMCRTLCRLSFFRAILLSIRRFDQGLDISCRSMCRPRIRICDSSFDCNDSNTNWSTSSVLSQMMRVVRTPTMASRLWIYLDSQRIVLWLQC
jgi:hypothetical protein